MSLYVRCTLTLNKRKKILLESHRQFGEAIHCRIIGQGFGNRGLFSHTKCSATTKWEKKIRMLLMLWKSTFLNPSTMGTHCILSYDITTIKEKNYGHSLSSQYWKKP